MLLRKDRARIVNYDPLFARFATRQFEPAKHTGTWPLTQKAKPQDRQAKRRQPRTCLMNIHQKIASSCCPTSKPVGADARAELLKDTGLGRALTDHTVTICWPQARGCADAQVRP